MAIDTGDQARSVVADLGVDRDLLQRIALAQELREGVVVRWRWKWLSHLLLLSLLSVPRGAQAIPPSLQGARLTVALGPSIGLGADPLVPLGSSIAVEAMWIVPGGSAHDFELGVRGEVIEGSAEPNGHELTIAGGASVALSRRRLVLGLAPLATGGLRLGVARDRGSGPELVIGPYLVLSVERSLFESVGLRLGVGVHATLTDPLRLTPAISLSLCASRTAD